MEAYEHTNGNGQADAASHADGAGGAIIAAIHAGESAHPTPIDIKDAVASIGVRLNENLQALSVHLDDANRIHDARVRQIAGMQDQLAAIQQELQGVQDFVRGLPQGIQTVQQQCDGKVQGLEQLLVSGAQTVAGHGQQLTAMARTLDDKASQLSSLEISVAALIRDIGKVATIETAVAELDKKGGERAASVDVSMAELNQKGAELAATVDGLVQGSRSLKRLTMLTSATAIVLAVIVGMQMLGGWPAVARYVALWTSMLI